MGGMGPVVGGPEQQYALKWNDFHASILSSFRHLRDQEDFIDVTIACDGCSFTAHKVVLSACSPYFRSLLKANPCQHPIVILRDVRVQDMEALLKFMYNGEVHIGQEQLADFLKTAQTLQVRGLAEVATKDPNKIPMNHTIPWSSSNSFDKLHTRRGSSISSDAQPPSKRTRSSDHKNSRYSESPPISQNNNEHLDKQPLPDNFLSQSQGADVTPNSNQLKTVSEPSSQIHSSNEDSNSYDEASDAEGTDNRPNSVTDLVLQPKLEPPDYSLDRSRNDMYDSQRQRGGYGGGLFNIPGLTAGLIPGSSGMHNNSPENFGGSSSGYGGTVEPKPVCRECGRIYSSISNLKQHIANVHTASVNWEPCPMCGKHFKTRQYLFNHLLQTHGIRQRGSRMSAPYPSNLSHPPHSPHHNNTSASSHSSLSQPPIMHPSSRAPSHTSSTQPSSTHPSSTVASSHTSSSHPSSTIVCSQHSSTLVSSHAPSHIPPTLISSHPSPTLMSSQASSSSHPHVHSSSHSISPHSSSHPPVQLVQPLTMSSLHPTQSHSSTPTTLHSLQPPLAHPSHISISHPPPAHPFSHIPSHPHAYPPPVCGSLSQTMHFLNPQISRISSSGFHSPLISSSTNVNTNSPMESNSEREVPHQTVIINSQKERDLTSAVEQCLQFLSSTPK